MTVNIAPRSVWTCAVLSILFSFINLEAQQNNGTISGHVTDPSAAPVGDAEVSAKPASGAVRGTTTDGEGKFSFSDLAPGSYGIEIKHEGFENAQKTVNLAPGATVEKTFPLALGTRSESATVNAHLSSIPTENPLGQVIMSASLDDYRNTPALSVTDMFDLTPGVTTEQSNGPRDISVSVRGSNERQTFGVRNIQMFEDGFPMTQPDGLGRTDVIDPHMYSNVDVVEGPSSALYGNDATGGAVNFHTRQIVGVEVGSDFGSFGYNNDYVTAGAAGNQYTLTAFLSNVRGSQYTDHTGYNTITGNLLGTYSLTPKDRITVMFLDNELATNLSIRLSLNQYNTNPWQQGCAALAAAGCASVSLYANGFNGARESLSADEAGLGRHDRRTLVGMRWEHDLTPDMTSRTQFVWDDRDINQPTSSTSALGPYPSYNVITDLLRHGSLLGRKSTTYIAAWLNLENSKSLTYNLAPGGNATLGGLTQTVLGTTWDAGFRARQEIELGGKWTATVGAGLEHTGLASTEENYTYPTNSTPATTLIPARRNYLEFAPEAALRYAVTQKLALHTHWGTGYGAPQITNLFVTPQGVFGNNTQLKPQTNVGGDAGFEWNAGAFLKLSAAAYQEWFHNELVTQSPGVNLQSYTFNAPASSHKGVQALADIRPLYHTLPGLRVRGSYLFDRQTYSNYFETLTAGNFATTFDRKGNLIPGVIPQYLNVRVVYDQTKGSLRGLGAFVEEDTRESFYLDNANLLRAPGSNTLNLNFHYTPSAEHGALSKFYFYIEIKNLTSKAYVSSANNISDSLSSSTGLENGIATLATSGSIWAGPPRAIYGGIKVRLFR